MYNLTQTYNGSSFDPTYRRSPKKATFRSLLLTTFPPSICKFTKSPLLGHSLILLPDYPFIMKFIFQGTNIIVGGLFPVTLLLLSISEIGSLHYSLDWSALTRNCIIQTTLNVRDIHPSCPRAIGFPRWSVAACPVNPLGEFNGFQMTFYYTNTSFVVDHFKSYAVIKSAIDPCVRRLLVVECPGEQVTPES